MLSKLRFVSLLLLGVSLVALGCGNSDDPVLPSNSASMPNQQPGGGRGNSASKSLADLDGTAALPKATPDSKSSEPSSSDAPAGEIGDANKAAELPAATKSEPTSSDSTPANSNEKASPPTTKENAPSDGTPNENQSNTQSTKQTGSETAMSISKSPFGTTQDGKEATLFTCKNANGIIVKLTNFGAAVVAVETPDRGGKLANINLGFDNVGGYEKHGAYFGCTVGRYANRIAKGKFQLDGQTYTLATNNGPNHLHGGVKGFNRMLWNTEEVKTADAVGVKFSYRSPDGEEGFPGNLDVTATYVLTNKNELRIDYEASTDKTTVLNLTNHCYWNLGGAGSGSVKSHELLLNADKYLPVDEGLIPTGDLASVTGTPLDFTKATAIGARINDIKADPVGYDHCFSLRSQDGSLALAARMKDPANGRVMEVLTTEPGIQLYTGNFLNGDPVNGGYQQHSAFCLETQHYPDSPNQPNFPSVVLKPGGKFRSTTVHRFSVE